MGLKNLFLLILATAQSLAFYLLFLCFEERLDKEIVPCTEEVLEMHYGLIFTECWSLRGSVSPLGHAVSLYGEEIAFSVRDASRHCCVQ